MREIKFRFWDKDLKKMCNRNPLTYDFWVDNIVPLQYTGLKDKNGVEIYEGDILKITPDRYSNYISLGYVEYDHDSARYRVTTGKGYDTRNAFDINCDADFEVIGNIYENPELLEEE